MRLTFEEIETIVEHGHVVAMYIQSNQVVKAIRGSQLLSKGMRSAEKATLEMLDTQYNAYFGDILILDSRKILYDEVNIRDFTLAMMRRIKKRKQEHVLL